VLAEGETMTIIQAVSAGPCYAAGWCAGQLMNGWLWLWAATVAGYHAARGVE
jgi:hypothetical protein